MTITKETQISITKIFTNRKRLMITAWRDGDILTAFADGLEIDHSSARLNGVSVGCVNYTAAGYQNIKKAIEVNS